MPDFLASKEPIPPKQSYWELFSRFLRFGLLAWGGPVAQIGMIRQELVDEEQWVSQERFNRALAVYQVLPGPEATELCVYFGMLAKGRLGGLLAGLAFILPGFLAMLGLSWFYVQYGMNIPALQAAFMGMQAVVGALIVRATYRIATHALLDGWLWGIGALALIAHLVNVHFIITLGAAGIIYALAKRGWVRSALMVAALLVVVSTLSFATVSGIAVTNASIPPPAIIPSPSLARLFGSGLRSGLLTFGGAYTVIPYLQADAVGTNGWMSKSQFLDGLGLSGILPAPLVIFGTFVGYLGGSWLGALAVTIGIFAPAFAFTLVGHRLMERLIAHTALHSFLDGVTAGVVGLISATALDILSVSLTNLPAVLIFISGLFVLFRWKAKWTIPVVVLCAALAGFLVYGVV